MNEPLKLTWGNDHSLEIKSHPSGGWLIATLWVKKKGGTRCYSVALNGPDRLTLEDIQRAWEAQGSRWCELEVRDLPNKYGALRVIWLPGNRCLQWFVLHIQQTPFDGLSFTDLTREIWNATM
jgi:hypothetical protein